MKAKRESDKEEEGKSEKPAASTGGAQADGMAQAHMYAALNYQQK